MNDPEVTSPFGRPPRLSRRDHERWFRSVQRDRSQAIFSICVKKTKEHVGNIGLKKIDQKNRSAEVWVYVGEADHRGRGMGERALRMLVRHAFRKRGLHRLQAWMLKSNQSSYRLFRKCGFRQEGELKDAFFGDGRFYTLRLLARIHR